MPLPKPNTYTVEDIYLLPDGQRAELIDGQIYNMAPPSPLHQKLVMELSATIRDYLQPSETTLNQIVVPVRFILLHLLFFLIRIIIIMLSRISP